MTIMFKYDIEICIRSRIKQFFPSPEKFHFWHNTYWFQADEGYWSVYMDDEDNIDESLNDSD